jgi:hypothetical protein
VQFSLTMTSDKGKNAKMSGQAPGVPPAPCEVGASHELQRQQSLNG